MTWITSQALDLNALQEKKAPIFAIELLDHKPIQSQLNHGTRCNMSLRNIDNITNITLEKCSWELVIFSICTESPVSKNKLLIRNLWNEQHYLSVYNSWQAEIPCWATVSHKEQFAQQVPSKVLQTETGRTAALIGIILFQQPWENNWRRNRQISKGAVTCQSSTVRTCLQTVLTKPWGKLDIGIGSGTLNSEEQHFSQTASEGSCLLCQHSGVTILC